MTSHEDLVEDAATAFRAGDFETTRQLALEGLSDQPDDVELLRLIGRASLELGREDAVLHLSALVARTPDDPGALVHLGFAHAAGGHAEEAVDVFARLVSLTPGDGDAAMHFAYAAHAMGRTEEAIAALSQAIEISGASPELLRSQVELGMASGLLKPALAAANQLDALDSKDAGNLLDIAELNLTLEQYKPAAAAFARLARVDVEDGHQTFAYHGQIEALLRGQSWREALDAAIAATSLDRHSLTTDLLAFVSVQLFGKNESRVAPEWYELELRLKGERATHRRLHAER